MARYAEPHFQYWNRSARRDIAVLRDLLESWFSHYPSEHAAELRSRIRDDRSFDSGVFELLLHEALLRFGCSLEIHPELPGSTRRPEFLVTEPDGSRWYLEAIVATGESEEEATIRSLKNRIYDALNELESPDYFVNIEIVAANRKQVPASRLKTFVRQRLVNRIPGPWRFEFDKWIIQFTPLAKRDESRGTPGLRPLGIIGIPPHVLRTAEAIREAVRQKAKRYGQLNAPFIIAVNALCEHVDDQDEIDALFGDFGPRGRAPNGAWQDMQGPRNTRVSGVLIASRLALWRLASAGVRLYHHPFAAHPYSGVLNKLPQAVVRESRVEPLDGLSLRQLFEIQAGWLDVDED